MPGGKYAAGSQAWGLCQYCGLRFYLRDLVFDGYFPGLRVCVDCFNPRHPQEFLQDVTDPVALWKPAPEDPPGAPVLSGALVGGYPSLTWTTVDLKAGPRVDAYAVNRASSTDGITYTAFVVLATFPVLYWADRPGGLALLVEEGNPVHNNGGVYSQTLAYVDTTVTAGNWYQYRVDALLVNDEP